MASARLLEGLRRGGHDRSFAGGLPDVDADVVAVGVVTGLDVPADLRDELRDGRLLRRAEREDVRFVAPKNDQRMTECQWKTAGHLHTQHVPRADPGRILSGARRAMTQNRSMDGVVDFDMALRDPERPTQMLPICDCGDRLHASDLGYCTMGDAIDLALFD